jgi:fructan beta-fructosidase
MTSSAFVIKKDYINFLLGGTSSPSAYVELLINGKNIVTARPVGNNQNVLNWISWNVSKYKGQRANIRIVADFNEQRKGFILLDQIEMGNRAKSSYLESYSDCIQAKKKWLLIPAEDSEISSLLSIVNNNHNILGVEQKITPARTRIDYYVPIDISNFKGQSLTIHISGVDKKDLICKNICQEDEYTFKYDEPYRQLWHMTPHFGWANDPNGMVYFNKTYHIAYQHNPYGTRHNNMHWGYAVSKDLVHWENRPLIIAPDTLGSIFSGSSIVDVNNTAGFGENAIIAIYTSAVGNNYERQRQCIAYSTDYGRSFIKHDGNPILSDPSRIDFRDPKVSWVNNQWIMSLATGQTISFFRSEDLKHWEKLSEFGEGTGSHKGIWECPDLIRLSYKGQEKWVLLVSINPGGPHGGSATQYFIGRFDGKNFIADTMDYPLWLDAGADNYAGVTFNNIPDKAVFIGWMSNWLYSNETPTFFFRNGMTMPRELFLKHDGQKVILASKPAPDIYQACNLITEEQAMKINDVGSIDQLLQNNNGAYRIDFTLIPRGNGKFGFKLINNLNEHADFMIDTNEGTISLDRSKSGLVSFHPEFARKPIISSIVKKNMYKMELFIDKQSAELFINDGDLVFTNTLFPATVYNKIQWVAENCSIAVENIKIYRINSN